LDWETQVRPLMEKYLGDLPVMVYIHLHHIEDRFAPEHRNVREIKKWLRGEPEFLAFSEVWNDILELFKEPAEIEPLDGGSSFTVRADVQSEELVLETDGESVALPSESILDLWQQVRQAGFVSADSLHGGLNQYARYVVPVMVRLPYIHPVAMSPNYGQFSDNPAGLRLATRTQESQPSLFAAAGLGSVESK
jgi:hypothetical protein